MGDLGQYNKLIVSIVMAGLVLLEDWSGWSFGIISEEWITTVLAVVWPVLVWLVPNQE